MSTNTFNTEIRIKSCLFDKDVLSLNFEYLNGEDTFLRNNANLTKSTLQRLNVSGNACFTLLSN